MGACQRRLKEVKGPKALERDGHAPQRAIRDEDALGGDTCESPL